jgi:hypothetical protein
MTGYSWSHPKKKKKERVNELVEKRKKELRLPSSFQVSEKKEAQGGSCNFSVFFSPLTCEKNTLTHL